MGNWIFKNNIVEKKTVGGLYEYSYKRNDDSGGIYITFESSIFTEGTMLVQTSNLDDNFIISLTFLKRKGNFLI